MNNHGSTEFLPGFQGKFNFREPITAVQSIALQRNTFHLFRHNEYVFYNHITGITARQDCKGHLSLVSLNSTFCLYGRQVLGRRLSGQVQLESLKSCVRSALCLHQYGLSLTSQRQLKATAKAYIALGGSRTPLTNNWKRCFSCLVLEFL